MRSDSLASALRQLTRGLFAFGELPKNAPKSRQVGGKVDGDLSHALPTAPSTGWFGKFPVTTILALQYGAMALAPAWYFENPNLSFIARVTLLGLMSSFAVEATCALLWPKPPGSLVPFSIVTPTAAKFIVVVGFCSTYISTLLGASTYATQVGAAAASPLAAIATPFSGWAYIGLGFLLYCFAKGEISRNSTLRWVLASALLSFADSIYSAITAGFARFALALAAGGLLVGLFKPRWLILGCLLSVILWPAVHELRNSNRADVVTSGSYGDDVSASSRLREDILLGEANGFTTSNSLGQPGLLEMTYVGIVPRFLDPLPRPEVATGKLLSVATGSSSSSSVTFTFFGNIWLLGGDGPISLVLVVGSIAGAVSLALRRISPFRLALFMSVVLDPLWIESSYPDFLAGVLQSSVEIAAALLLIRLNSIKRRILL
jgi:hypothetical protein